jgi:hypothetical protein
MTDREMDYIDILRALDQGDDWETPPGGDWQDWQAAQTRFETLVESVRRIEGLEHIYISYGQDASFFGDIDVPVADLHPSGKDARSFNNITVLVSDKVPPGSTIYALLVRVSKWGTLATVDDDSLVQPDVLEQIKALLAQCGYVYIPRSVLAQEYDSGGTVWHPGAGRPTWWDRYFDYL